jgi:hypothetical protein
LQVFQAFSAPRTFWIAVSRVKGGSGGRDSGIDGLPIGEADLMPRPLIGLPE